MSVDVRRMLETMGGSLMTGQVLTLEADYQQRTAFMLGTLLLFASQEWDAAAERLTDENRAMREIFCVVVQPLVELRGVLALGHGTRCGNDLIALRKRRVV